MAGLLSAPIRYVGALFLLGVEGGKYLLPGRLDRDEALRQFIFLGVGSLPLVVLTTAFSGMVLSLHTAHDMREVGATGLVGGMVALSMARELGPVVTAVAVAARGGAGMASQIATMRATEQVDALRAMGISPAEYLVAPRMVACVLALPLLCSFGDLSGLLGGWGMALLSGISSRAFWSSVAFYLTPRDLLGGLLKTVFFGALISLAACKEGLSSFPSAEGVGRATTRAVVASVFLVYGADYLLSAAIF